MKKIKKFNYPEKSSINLITKDNFSQNTGLEIGLFVIFLILLALFTKLGVIDKLVEINNAKQTYENMQTEISALKESNSDYETVRQEYSHYGNGYLSEEELALADRKDVIDLIEKYVMSQADIEDMIIRDNIISVSILNIKLSTVSSIVENLESDESVLYVTVSTAATDTSKASNRAVTATMMIALQKLGGEE